MYSDSLNFLSTTKKGNILGLILISRALSLLIVYKCICNREALQILGILSYQHSNEIIQRVTIF